MNVLINIAKYILPFLVRFLDKHGDEWLEKFYDKIGRILDTREEEKMSTLRVETNVGANVEFALGRKGTIRRVAEDGVALVTGLDETDSPTVTVSMDGYMTEEKKIQSMQNDVTVLIDLEKIKPVEEVVKEEVVEPLTPIAAEVISKAASINITNIEEAKKDYKEIEEFVKSQKSTIENALKSGAYGVAQSAGADLINGIRTRLNESMDYYVKLRSKLNPLGSWVEFRDYCEYTSMIAGIFFIRQNLVTWLGEILKQIEKI